MVCCFVTDCGALETPSATTPLSAAKTSSCFLLSALCTRPVIPASWMEISSSRPRLPGGLASRAVIALRSSGATTRTSASNSFCMALPFLKFDAAPRRDSSVKRVLALSHLRHIVGGIQQMLRRISPRQHDFKRFWSAA